MCLPRQHRRALASSCWPIRSPARAGRGLSRHRLGAARGLLEKAGVKRRCVSCSSLRRTDARRDHATRSTLRCRHVSKCRANPDRRMLAPSSSGCSKTSLGISRPALDRRAMPLLRSVDKRSHGITNIAGGNPATKRVTTIFTAAVKCKATGELARRHGVGTMAALSREEAMSDTRTVDLSASEEFVQIGPCERRGLCRSL